MSRVTPRSGGSALSDPTPICWATVLCWAAWAALRMGPELGARSERAEVGYLATADTTPTSRTHAPTCRRRPRSSVTWQYLGVVSLDAEPHISASCAKTPKNGLFSENVLALVFFEKLFSKETKIRKFHELGLGFYRVGLDLRGSMHPIWSSHLSRSSK